MPLLNSLRERSEIVKSVGIRSYPGADGLPIVESHQSDQIKTLEQLLEASNADLETYEVERWEANKWGVFSNENGLQDLHQVKAKLKRKEFTRAEFREMLKEDINAFKRGMSGAVAKGAKPCASGIGRMVEFALPDLHLGKLAWSPETGHGNYDVDIACEVHRQALADLISRAPKAEEAWFVVGNDFYNVDNKFRTTTGGTPQDEDGRWQRTWRRGKVLLMESIGMLRKKYPKVKVIVMPGNHDEERMWYLGELLMEVFSDVDGVEVDNRPLFRKYYQWGETGIGYAHGHGLKIKDAGNYCQHEARDIWGSTKRFEFHIGHFHHEAVKWFGGVLVRFLPSLTAPDAWHVLSGYVMSEAAAIANVYNQRGLDHQIVHLPDVNLYGK
jgi:hypothetical protein